MLPTDPLLYVVDEFTAYDSVGETTDPCKISSLSKMFGSTAHKARVGKMMISTKSLLNIVKAEGNVQVLMKRTATIHLMKADFAQNSNPLNSEIRGNIVRSGA